MNLSLSGKKLLYIGFVLTAILFLRGTQQAFSKPGVLPQQAQQGVTKLELNKPIEQQLSGEAAHSYSVMIAANQFLRVTVEQRGIDVVVLLYGPGGEKLSEVDSPNGTKGPEPLLFIAEAAGDYRIEVRSLEKSAPAGRYEIKLEELRAATEQDSKRMAQMSALNEAVASGQQADQLFQQGRYTEALPLAEKALSLSERALGTGHPEVAAALNRIGLILREKADYKQAAGFFQRALEIVEKTLGPEHQYTIIILNNLASVRRSMSDFTGAEPLFQRALASLEKAPGNGASLATLLINYAGLYQDKGDYSRAEPMFRRALAILEKAVGPDDPAVAAALSNLAGIRRFKDDLNGAEALYLRAIEIVEKKYGPEHPIVTNPLRTLALVYTDKGDYAKAESLFLRSLMILEKRLGTEHPVIILALDELASLYRKKRDYARAEPLLMRAVKMAEKANDHLALSNVLDNLATLYQDKGQYEQAEPLFQRSLSLREKMLDADHPKIAESLNNITLIYMRLGNYARVESLLRRAMSTVERTYGPDTSPMATVLINLGLAYEAQGETAKALPFYEREAEIRERNIALVMAGGSERQKRLYLSTLGGDTNGIISFNVRASSANKGATRLALTTVLRRKGRALDVMTEQVGSLRRRLDARDRELLDELTLAREQLAALSLKDSVPVAQRRAEMARLEATIEKLESEISARSEEFRLQSRPVTIESVQQAMPKDSALVEFMLYWPWTPKGRGTEERVGAMRYIAYVLRSDGEPAWVDLGEASAIDQSVTALRRALADRRRMRVRQAARAFDQKVMRPVRKLTGTARHLLISPDGMLNLVPFAALVDERNRYLIESYLITYLTSGRDLLRLQVKTQSKQPPTLIANPQFELSRSNEGGKTGQADASGRRSADFTRMSFNPLPGTAEEARMLSTILRGAKLLTQAQATEEEMKRVSGPSILHVATHGFFLPDQRRDMSESGLVMRTGSGDEESSDGAQLENPLLRSGLALAGANGRQSSVAEDGVLTALEASSLDLWGTKLVVLSACDTGLGDVRNGDGVFGLRRSLVLAGAETEVMTLWQVSDAATRDLMIEYYRRLERGEGRAEALRRTQLGMLKSPGRTHPFFWASFIPVGEWRALEQN